MNASAYTHLAPRGRSHDALGGEAKGGEVELTPGDLDRHAREAGLATPSLLLLDLDSGRSADLEPMRSLYPASTIKVPLVAAALAELADGRLDERTAIAVDAANMTANDAESPLRPGYVTSLDELMRLAITRSDNVATNLLIDLVGRRRATAIVGERLQLGATAFHRKLSGAEPLIVDPEWDGEHRNTHPAADSAHLYAAIARDEIAGATRLRALLAAQAWNDKLSPGLLPGDRFLHKTGETQEVSHDGGILLTREGRRYVLIVHTGLPANPINDRRFATFMERIRPSL